MKKPLMFLMLLVLLTLLCACAAPVDQTRSFDPAAAAATRAAIQYLQFDPAEVGQLQSATLTWTRPDDRSTIHTGSLTEPDDLRTLEALLSSATPMENIPMCFDAAFKHELTLVRSDGAVTTLLLSIDECPYLRQGDQCFSYKQSALEATGESTNAVIYDLFGANSPTAS